MAVSGDFSNFRAVYDDLTQEVLRSHAQFLADHLTNWFRALDSTAGIAPVIQELQRGLDLKKWLQEQQGGGMGGTLSWPKEPEKQLGMKLLFFRSAAEAGSSDVIATFGFQFIPSSDKSISRAAQRFVEQVFGPMARELRRYLESRASDVPAADRIVKLDHNSTGYKDAIAALETLENVVRGANDYPDPEE